MIKSFLVVFFLKYILKFDSRLYIDNLNCAIVGGLVSLSVPFVLANDLTVNFLVTEYSLVQIDKLTVKARVDLEILRTLDADSLEELVVESIKGQIVVISLLGIFFIIF